MEGLEKLSPKLFFKIMNLVRDAVIITDGGGSVIDMNWKAKTQFENALSDDSIFKLIHPRESVQQLIYPVEFQAYVSSVSRLNSEVRVTLDKCAGEKKDYLLWLIQDKVH